MADSRTSLISINSLIFVAPTAIGSKIAGCCRYKGWAAAGPQRPAYSGRGHIVSPHAQLVIANITSAIKRRYDRMALCKLDNNNNNNNISGKLVCVGGIQAEHGGQCVQRG